jgi:hypothetical protein
VHEFILTFAAATFVLGTLALVWYSPFGFGDAFLEALGRQKERHGNPWQGMTWSFVALLAAAFALRALLRTADVDSVAGGAWFGLLAGVLVSAAMLSEAFWAATPIEAFAIQATFRVAYLVLMGVVFAAWD